MELHHQDASALMGSGIEAAAGTCVVCGQALGWETWWVTRYPHGEHTRCRDWTRHPFPFERQLTALRKLWRQLDQDAIRREVARVGRELAQMQARWPGQGAQTVQSAMDSTRKLRSALLVAGVAPKLLSQM